MLEVRYNQLSKIWFQFWQAFWRYRVLVLTQLQFNVSSASSMGLKLVYPFIVMWSEYRCARPFLYNVFPVWWVDTFDFLVQDCLIYNVLAMDIMQSCTKISPLYWTRPLHGISAEFVCIFSHVRNLHERTYVDSNCPWYIGYVPNHDPWYL